jgi:hypothetical protein
MTDEVLHGLARLLLRVCSPRTADRFLRRMGAFLPQRRTRGEVRRAAIRMRTRGTCLSRAMAIAARAPKAEMVIGVAPGFRERFVAHAWLEFDGAPLEAPEFVSHEIARIRSGRAMGATVSDS